MRAVWDSNIVIDLLNGVPKAGQQAHLYQPVLSTVTFAEVLAGSIRRNTYNDVLNFLKTMELVPLDAGIAELSAQIRAKQGIKLPDAIIYATAKSLGLLLITRNTRDFDQTDVMIRVPYEL